MIHDRDGVKRLGTYLGLAIDDTLLARPDSISIIYKSLWVFKKKYGPEVRHNRETCSSLARVIFDADFSRLSVSVDRESTLARDVFSRLYPDSGEDEFPEFRAVFRRFIRWFTAATVALQQVHGLKKEGVSLDNPHIQENISELRELPSRRLGDLSYSYGNYAAISRYVEALLNKYEDNVIPRENCRRIIEVMGKVSGYPTYYKSISPAQKLEEARPILVSISELQLSQGNEPAKADLLSALGLLLFNLFPTPKLLKFVTKLQPSPGNDALQYDHSAILAMNFMLSGKLDDAAAYNQKALEFAGDEEKRAHVHILDSCIAINRGRTEEAVNALYRCSVLTKDPRMKATALFYMGIIYYGMGRDAEAMESFRQSKAGLTEELDLMNVGNNIGSSALLLGDLKTAVREFENVEEIGRYMTGNSAKALKSVACGCLGLIYLHKADHSHAIERFKEALRLDRETHDKKGAANQLGNIGLALKAKKEYGAALEYFKSALNVSFLEDYLEGARFSLAQIEQVMALQGRYDEAEVFRGEMLRRNPGIAKMLHE